MSVLNGLIFQYKNIYFCVYTLNENFSLIYVISSLYANNKHSKAKAFNVYLLKTFSMHWVRVSFRGKGFRLRKFKDISKLTFNFGHSHWAKMVLESTEFFFKKIKRQNYICLSKHYRKVNDFKLILKKVKSLNVYTKRGLRLRKQFIRRRFGKISQVVSSLH